MKCNSRATRIASAAAACFLTVAFGSSAATADVAIQKFSKGGTVVELPEGICDGVKLPIRYQQLRGGLLFKGVFQPTADLACAESVALVEGTFAEYALDKKTGQALQGCTGRLLLSLTDSGLDARWNVTGATSEGSCSSVGREFVSNDLLTTDASRGSFVSLANYSSLSLQDIRSFEVYAPIMCFQQANNNSEEIALLEAGVVQPVALAADGKTVLVHFDSNQSPWLQTQAKGRTCFVRAGVKYIGVR